MKSIGASFGKRINAMDAITITADNTTSLDAPEDDPLVFDLSDEELEAAAGSALCLRMDSICYTGSDVVLTCYYR
jgi:hypothetical protein